MNEACNRLGAGHRCLQILSPPLLRAAPQGRKIPEERGDASCGFRRECETLS